MTLKNGGNQQSRVACPFTDWCCSFCPGCTACDESVFERTPLFLYLLRALKMASLNRLHMRDQQVYVCQQRCFFFFFFLSEGNTELMEIKCGNLHWSQLKVDNCCLAPTLTMHFTHCMLNVPCAVFIVNKLSFVYAHGFLTRTHCDFPRALENTLNAFHETFAKNFKMLCLPQFSFLFFFSPIAVWPLSAMQCCHWPSQCKQHSTNLQQQRCF